MKSWKTTATGWGAFIAATTPLVMDVINETPVSSDQWAIAVGALLFALGMTAARDNSVTSRQAGAE